jgi:hypothetical protein
MLGGREHFAFTRGEVSDPHHVGTRYGVLHEAVVRLVSGAVDLHVIAFS